MCACAGLDRLRAHLAARRAEQTASPRDDDDDKDNGGDDGDNDGNGDNSNDDDDDDGDDNETITTITSTTTTIPPAAGSLRGAVARVPLAGRGAGQAVGARAELLRGAIGRVRGAGQAARPRDDDDDKDNGGDNGDNERNGDNSNDDDDDDGDDDETITLSTASNLRGAVARVPLAGRGAGQAVGPRTELLCAAVGRVREAGQAASTSRCVPGWTDCKRTSPGHEGPRMDRA